MSPLPDTFRAATVSVYSLYWYSCYLSAGYGLDGYGGTGHGSAAVPHGHAVQTAVVGHVPAGEGAVLVVHDLYGTRLVVRTLRRS